MFLRKADQFQAQHNGIFFSCEAFRQLVADDFQLSKDAATTWENDWCSK